MRIIICFLLLPFQIYAVETIHFESTWNLYKQTMGTHFSLPQPLSERTKLSVRFELPAADGPALKKVFTETAVVNEFKVIFEVYHFNQNSQRYLSQQIFLYKDEKLITRCTSYFGLDQKYLVPGSCAGVKDDTLYGVALYK